MEVSHYSTTHAYLPCKPCSDKIWEITTTTTTTTGPGNQCQCNKVALKVEMVTWDCKFSPQLPQMFADGVLHRILTEDIVYLQVLPSQCTVSQNGLLPLCPGPPNTRL